MHEYQQTHQSKNPEPSPQRQTTCTKQIHESSFAANIQRARINPKSLTPYDVLQLQRIVGNRAVGRLLSSIRNPSMVKQAPIHRPEIPDEENLLQVKFEGKPEEKTCTSCPVVPTIQRQEIPKEEEPLQDKNIDPVQSQEIPEEEESLQAKRENNTEMPDNFKADSPIQMVRGLQREQKVNVRFPSPSHEVYGTIKEVGYGGTYYKVEFSTNKMGWFPENQVTPIITMHHRDWVNKYEMEKWVTGVETSNPEKAATIHSLNQAQHEGSLRGESLLYLGCGQDVEHPLLTTAATRFTFVGIDPNVIADPSTAVTGRSQFLSDTVKGIIKTLQSFAKLGVTVASLLQPLSAEITVKDDTSGKVLLIIRYYALTYDEYISTTAHPQYDILMDKDSWLSEWKNANDYQVAQGIAAIMNTGGLWMGGFDTHSAFAKSQLTEMFDDITDDISPYNQRWSGYEYLHIRRRNQSPASTAKPDNVHLDELLGTVAKIFDDRIGRLKKLSEENYSQFLKSLETDVLPYLPSGTEIKDTDLDTIAEFIMSKLKKVNKDHFDPKLAEVTNQLKDINKRVSEMNN